MPLYEFKCSSCKIIFEDICDMSITHRECPECHSLCNRIMSLNAKLSTWGDWESFGEKHYGYTQKDRDLMRNADKQAYLDFD